MITVETPSGNKLLPTGITPQITTPLPKPQLIDSLESTLRISTSISLSSYSHLSYITSIFSSYSSPTSSIDLYRDTLKTHKAIRTLHLIPIIPLILHKVILSWPQPLYTLQSMKNKKKLEHSLMLEDSRLSYTGLVISFSISRFSTLISCSSHIYLLLKAFMSLAGAEYSSWASQ